MLRQQLDVYKVDVTTDVRCRLSSHASNSCRKYPTVPFEMRIAAGNPLRESFDNRQQDVREIPKNCGRSRGLIMLSWVVSRRRLESLVSCELVSLVTTTFSVVVILSILHLRPVCITLLTTNSSSAVFFIIFPFCFLAAGRYSQLLKTGQKTHSKRAICEILPTFMQSSVSTNVFERYFQYFVFFWGGEKNDHQVK